MWIRSTCINSNAAEVRPEDVSNCEAAVPEAALTREIDVINDCVKTPGFSGG